MRGSPETCRGSPAYSPENGVVLGNLGRRWCITGPADTDLADSRIVEHGTAAPPAAADFGAHGAGFPLQVSNSGAYAPWAPHGQGTQSAAPFANRVPRAFPYLQSSSLGRACVDDASPH